MTRRLAYAAALTLAVFAAFVFGRADSQFAFYDLFLRRDWTFGFPAAVLGLFQEGNFSLQFVTSALMFFSILILSTRRSGNAAMVAAALVLTAAFAYFPYDDRWSVLFIVCAFALVEKPGAKNTIFLWLLAFVWSRANVGFVLLPALLAVRFVGELLDGKRDEARRTALCFAGAAAFTLFSPVSWAVFWRNITASEAVRALTGFTTPDFHFHRGFVICVLLLLAAIGLRPSRWSERCTAALALFALFAGEHFAPLLAVVTALAVERFIDERRPLDDRDRTVPVLGMSAGYALVIVSAALVSKPEVRIPALQPLWANIIIARSQIREPFVLWNEIRVGSELQHLGISPFVRHPALLAFQSDEGLGLLQDYLRIFRVAPEWEEALNRRGVSAAIVREEGSLRTVLEEKLGWKVQGFSSPVAFPGALKDTRGRYLLLVRPATPP